MAFCIIIDLFMAYKYPISDVFHWFCKIARFFATEPKTVYIANDNEESGAGEDGALRTGALLIKEGVDVRIIKLPLPEGLDKIDIAEYFINNPVKEFKVLMDGSIPYYQYIINQFSTSLTGAENHLSSLRFQTFNRKVF